jgi:hypothetical protein
MAGLIIRHVEYLVKSERFRSEVIRRYSDFQVIATFSIFTACRAYFSVLYEKKCANLPLLFYYMWANERFFLDGI